MNFSPKQDHRQMARLKAIEEADKIRQRHVDVDLIDFRCPSSCGHPIVVKAETIRGIPMYRVHGCCDDGFEHVMNVLTIAEAKRRGMKVK